MSTFGWFDDLPVLGKLSPAEAAAKLREIGDNETADALETPPRGPRAFGVGDLWPFRERPWQHTAHALGYLAPSPPGADPLPIRHAGNIAADESLKEARLKITLDRLRVADYPGRGTHRILLDFYAQNQVSGEHVEHLHFNATYRVREGERAGIAGYPIFVGLNVGREGVAFKCFTVNVRNDHDEAFLAAMDSDVFRAGLKLATTLQPAIAPLTGMAVALTRSIAKRNRNVPVRGLYRGSISPASPPGPAWRKGHTWPSRFLRRCEACGTGMSGCITRPRDKSSAGTIRRSSSRITTSSSA